jgi:bisphosphoglycerate-independent phosphoglycerate mutase (AlkP superfamily)
MGMDYHGETCGSDSAEYRNHAIRQDAWLAPLIQEWVSVGYTVLVTGDHGINADGAHGGTTPEQREVPLFWIRHGVWGRGDTGEIVSHLQIAPTILKLLGLPVPETMKQPPLNLA